MSLAISGRMWEFWSVSGAGWTFMAEITVIHPGAHSFFFLMLMFCSRCCEMENHIIVILIVKNVRILKLKRFVDEIFLRQLPVFQYNLMVKLC